MISSTLKDFPFTYWLYLPLQFDQSLNLKNSNKALMKNLPSQGSELKSTF